MPSATTAGRKRGATGGSAERLLQTAVHEQRWVDPVREVPQFLHRVLEIVTDLLEDLLRRVGIGIGELPRKVHVHSQGDQVLLRAVVEVALDGTALRVAGFDDARVRRAARRPGVEPRRATPGAPSRASHCAKPAPPGGQAP